jgi:hypothetical protein
MTVLKLLPLTNEHFYDKKIRLSLDPGISSVAIAGLFTK